MHDMICTEEGRELKLAGEKAIVHMDVTTTEQA